MTNPIIEYWPSGRVQSVEYMEYGKLHRDPLEGPASVWCDEDGKIIEYWVNDKRHNPYGPAIIDYIKDEIRWYFNHKKYTIEVNEYLDKNNLDYKTMSQTDFDIMWCFIL